jgi:hypothetical protein
MKKILLAGCAALFLATGTAHAAEISKQYRGTWCYTEWRTIYERCSGETGIVFTEINSTTWGECTLTGISRSKYGGHKLLGTCTRGVYPIPENRGIRHLRHKFTEERWWLGSNNTRLQIIEKFPPCGDVDLYGNEIKCE